MQVKWGGGHSTCGGVVPFTHAHLWNVPRTAWALYSQKSVMTSVNARAARSLDYIFNESSFESQLAHYTRSLNNSPCFLVCSGALSWFSPSWFSVTALTGRPLGWLRWISLGWTHLKQLHVGVGISGCSDIVSYLPFLAAPLAAASETGALVLL